MQPARCVARAALPDDSSLADSVRVGLVRAGSARDGCLVALGADDPFAPAALPGDYSVPVDSDDSFPSHYSGSVPDGYSAPGDCSGQGGLVARDLCPDARLQPVQ